MLCNTDDAFELLKDNIGQLLQEQFRTTRDTLITFSQLILVLKLVKHLKNGKRFRLSHAYLILDMHMSRVSTFVSLAP